MWAEKGAPPCPTDPNLLGKTEESLPSCCHLFLRTGFSDSSPEPRRGCTSSLWRPPGSDLDSICHLYQVTFLSPQRRRAPPWDHRLDLPATYRARGQVPEDPQGTGAAQMCVAAGNKVGVGGVVEADGTLLSCRVWERGRHKLGYMGAKGGQPTHAKTTGQRTTQSYPDYYLMQKCSQHNQVKKSGKKTILYIHIYHKIPTWKKRKTAQFPIDV